MDHMTTVRFPSGISAVSGAHVGPTTDAPARFQVLFEPGNPVFSVRALASNAVATVNVFWRDQTYVLALESSEDPTLSLVCVTSLPAVTTNAVVVAMALPPDASSQALELLKRPGLRETELLVRRKLSAAFPVPGGILRTDEAVAVLESGRIAVRCTFFNETGRVFRPVAEGLRVEVGGAVATPALVEIPDNVAIGRSAPVYLVISTAGLDASALIQQRIRASWSEDETAVQSTRHERKP